MNKKNTELLWETFPNLYRGRNLSLVQSLIPFGFECGDGWFSIIWDLSEKLEKLILDLPENEREHYCASQVKEKFGCYDKQTEALTKSGWKFFKNINKDDEIAVLNGEHLEYHHPSDIISYHYRGKMYRLKTRGVDLLVTPNHNLYVAKGTYYNGKYSPPKKVEYPMEFTTPGKYFGKNKRFIKTAIWGGEHADFFVLPEWSYKSNFGFDAPRQGIFGEMERQYVHEKVQVPMGDWLEFLGFYVAEGCSDASSGTVAIASNNVDGGIEKEYTKNLIDNIGFKYSITMKDRSAAVFRIYKKQLALWLIEHCGHLAQNKKAPPFIKELSPDLINRFLIGLYRGDGHKTKTAHILTTVSKQLADDVQELILKTGDTSYCFVLPPTRGTFVGGREIIGRFDIHCVNWLKKSRSHNTANKGMAKKSVEELVDYDGDVFCVTVPHNIIYVRRNGIPVWCGNSLRFYMHASTDEMETLISEAETKTETTCESCGSPGSLRGKGWLSIRCDKCWKKPK